VESHVAGKRRKPNPGRRKSSPVSNIENSQNSSQPVIDNGKKICPLCGHETIKPTYDKCSVCGKDIKGIIFEKRSCAKCYVKEMVKRKRQDEIRKRMEKCRRMNTKIISF
jgi:hypothetical protein